MTEFTKFPDELVIAMIAGCSPGHSLTPGFCLDIVPGSNLVTHERTRSVRYRLVQPIETLSAPPTCAGSVPDDIRARGWTVAVHNDYQQGGTPHTFWLFTKDGRYLKGEGRTDHEALNQVREQLDATTNHTPEKTQTEASLGERLWHVFVRGKFCTSVSFPEHLNEDEVRRRLQLARADDVEIKVAP
jgi:hypothetical protein